MMQKIEKELRGTNYSSREDLRKRYMNYKQTYTNPRNNRKTTMKTEEYTDAKTMRMEDYLAVAGRDALTDYEKANNLIEGLDYGLYGSFIRTFTYDIYLLNDGEIETRSKTLEMVRKEILAHKYEKKNHTNQGKAKANVARKPICFKCHEPGHLSRNCTNERCIIKD